MSIEEREENREHREHGENEARSELMRAGVRARVARLARTTGAGARRWSPPVLMAVLSAGAFGALLNPDDATAGAALLGAATAVGGNMLTDIVKAAIARLGGNTGDGDNGDGESSRQGVETELERRIQQILEGGGREAEELRAEIARLLEEVGAVGAAIEAAIQAGDRDLQERLACGLAGLGREFAEFGFTLAAVEDRLRVLRDGQDAQGAQLGVVVGLQYRQATDIRLLLQLVSDLPRQHPDGTPGAPGAGRVRWGEGCPYRGLVPFTEADAEVFYGREVLAAQLVTTVSRRLSFPGMVVVTGASGAGKSSLLRAGLLPAIGRGELTAAAREWPVQVVEPTGSPLTRLAGALAALANLPAPEVVRSLSGDPRQAPLLARQAVETDARRRTLSASAAAGGRLVLVVDQFEEIFTLTPEADGQATQAAAEREAFIAALHAAATVPCGEGGDPAALVVVAVRGDFVDRCAAHPHLAAALQDGPFVVGPMRETDLRRVVTGPADAAGLTIEPGLVDVILSELRAPGSGCEAGVLPLLSQTMLTVWEHREGDRLTSRGYARTGGVTHAVATSAETAYTALAPDRQETARRVFQQLTAVTGDDVLARRTVERTALHTGRSGAGRAAVEEVLEVFARRRLVVVDAGRVQISHDVLLSSWPRLRTWLADERADRLLHAEVLQDTDEWDGRGRDASFLYRGIRLQAAEEGIARWRADPGRYAGFDLPGPAAAFLHAGIRAATRTRRRRQLRFTVLAGLLVISIITAVAAVRVGQDARQQRAQVVSRQVASHSQTLPDGPVASARLAAAAWAIAPTGEARAGLDALLRQPARAVLTGHTDAVSSVAFSLDGTFLASAGGDGTVRIWDMAKREQIGSLEHAGPVSSVAFNRDGTLLATGSVDKTVRIWDVAKRELRSSLDHGNLVSSVAFSPDGTRLASGGRDAMVRIWDIDTGEQTGVKLAGHTETVSSVAFSPDGKRLASGGLDYTVRIWDVTTSRPVGIPLKDVNRVESVVLGSDGAYRVVGSYEGMVRIWDVTTGKQVGPPLTATEWKSAVPSLDGTRLAAAGKDGAVRVWDTATDKQIGPPLDHIGEVKLMAFSPNGTRLVIAGKDSTVRIWDVTTGNQVGPPLGRISLEFPVVFSPDGTRLATFEGGRRVRIWDVTTGKQIGPPLDRISPEFPVVFSPDGTRLATAATTTARAWDVATGRQIGLPLTTGGWIRSMVFSPDGTYLVTGGMNFVVLIWDVIAGQQVGPPLPGTGQVTSVVFSPDGKRLASSEEDGRVWTWNIELPGNLLDAVCDIAGRSFTREEWQQYIPDEPYHQPNCPTIR